MLGRAAVRLVPCFCLPVAVWCLLRFACVCLSLPACALLACFAWVGAGVAFVLVAFVAFSNVFFDIGVGLSSRHIHTRRRAEQ